MCKFISFLNWNCSLDQIVVVNILSIIFILIFYAIKTFIKAVNPFINLWIDTYIWNNETIHLLIITRWKLVLKHVWFYLSFLYLFYNYCRSCCPPSRSETTWNHRWVNLVKSKNENCQDFMCYTSKEPHWLSFLL